MGEDGCSLSDFEVCGLIQIRNIPANSLSLDVRSGLLDGLMRARKEKMEAIVIFGEGRDLVLERTSMSFEGGIFKPRCWVMW